jgi:hypothetical protein
VPDSLDWQEQASHGVKQVEEAFHVQVRLGSFLHRSLTPQSGGFPCVHSGAGCFWRDCKQRVSPMVARSSGLGAGLPDTRPTEPQCATRSSFAWKACRSTSGPRPSPPPSSAGPAPYTSRPAGPGGGRQPMCSSCQLGLLTPWPSPSASSSRSLMLIPAASQPRQ